MAETYNEAVEKLRKIVADIENGDLDVDILSEKVCLLYTSDAADE